MNLDFVSVHKHAKKRTWPISSHLDLTLAVNNPYLVLTHYWGTFSSYGHSRTSKWESTSLDYNGHLFCQFRQTHIQNCFKLSATANSPQQQRPRKRILTAKNNLSKTASLSLTDERYIQNRIVWILEITKFDLYRASMFSFDCVWYMYAKMSPRWPLWNGLAVLTQLDALEQYFLVALLIFA